MALLDRTDGPWWAVWRTAVPAAHVRAVLTLLQQRPTPEVKTRCRVLLTHADPEIQALAGAILRA